MKQFVDALGPVVTSRMRRVFFERELDDLDLQVMGDPAEQHVLVMPMAPGVPFDLERATAAVQRVGVQELVVADQNRWQQLDAVVAIPRLELAT